MDVDVDVPSAAAADGAGVDALIRRVHLAAEEAGEDGYADPLSGFFVFTRARLLANGRCCGSGCRHCPYDAAGPTAEGRGAGPVSPDGD